MGAVYEAEQLATRKHRALKVLTNRFGSDDKAQARFVREATVGAEIRSDHVVDVIGAGIDEGTGLPWLAMELLDGMDLKRLTDARGSMEPAHVHAVFAQLGHGLAAAHAAGVVHRDLKPENVFVSRSRRADAPYLVKILDFGISKITHEAAASTDTATIGSPMWMAPEQINAEPVSARTDVWALGLLAFWAVSGRVYWKAAYGERVTVQALFAEQLFADLVTPSERAQGYGVAQRIPPGFDDWFGQCVARDPSERFTDAAAAMVALGGVLEPWASAAGPAQRPLLPEPGAPAEASLARSEPVLGPLGAGHPSGLALMAGTTADMMSIQSREATVAGTSDFTEPPGVTGMQRPEVPVSEKSAELVTAESAGRSKAPAVGKIVAAAAIPAALAGAVVAGIVFWEPEPAPKPLPIVAEVREQEPFEFEPDVGTQTPEIEPEPTWTGLPTPPKPLPKRRADLSSLPAASGIEFLGWTADGSVAALLVSYGAKKPAEGFANYLQLVVELDGATGSVVRTFVLDRDANASLSKDDPLARAAKASIPGKRWLERRTELLLRTPEARREPARRDGELTLSFENVPTGTKVRVQAKRSGFDLGWWGFDALADGDTVPSLHVQWVEGGSQRTLVRTPVEVEVDVLRKLAARPGSDVTLEGPVRVYWTGDARRALVTVSFQTRDAGVADRRWFVVEPPASVSGTRPRIRG